MRRFLILLILLIVSVGVVLVLDDISTSSQEDFLGEYVFLVFSGFVFTIFAFKQKRKIWYLLPLFFFLATIYAVTISKNVDTVKNFVMISRVIDGDTVEVVLRGDKYMVRLIGVDAPEVEKGECYGNESKLFVEELLSGKRVWIYSDSRTQNKDQYGRLLRYIFLSNGEMANVVIVREGYAKEYFFGGVWYEFRDEFVTAEKEAILHNKGLWAECEK